MSVSRIGLWGGGVLFVCLLLWSPSSTLSPEAQKVLAMTVLVGIWWVTEALPIPITSLLPAVLLPLLGVMTSQAAIKNYAHDLIFLLMGGLFLAQGIEKWNLHKRIALHTMVWIGANPRQILLGCMVSSAFLSMWISNTATTLMMMPIALALLNQLKFAQPPGAASSPRWWRNMSYCLLLGIAYSASIGGMGTLIGTPPNVLFAGQFGERFPLAPSITFATWLLVAFPLVFIFVPCVWAMFVWILSPIPSAKALGGFGKDMIRAELANMGPMVRGERWMAGIFAATACLWIFREPIVLSADWSIPGWTALLSSFEVFRDVPVHRYITDATVVLCMVMLCFVIRIRVGTHRESLLDWDRANRIPWGMLLLFGGGLAIAKGFEVSGLSEWIGQLAQAGSRLSLPLMIGSIVAGITFLTEITSNTATTAILLPILADTATGLQLNPLLFMIPATLAASCAFMLPVATLPNAIVFSTGLIPIRKMVAYGFFINLAGIVLITMITYVWGIPMLAISSDRLPDWAVPVP